ncbi:hypothetical protein L208DRAFT_1414386 [Tricholoma matsutake]|nr:hypothetical protein L208DRAFT_1414386 [Tricholoma matsutake 945]
MYCNRLNARTSPAKQSGADMISLTNIRNLDSDFPVADASYNKSQVMHLASIPNRASNSGDMLKIHNCKRIIYICQKGLS